MYDFIKHNQDSILPFPPLSSVLAYVYKPRMYSPLLRNWSMRHKLRLDLYLGCMYESSLIITLGVQVCRVSLFTIHGLPTNGAALPRDLTYVQAPAQVFNRCPFFFLLSLWPGAPWSPFLYHFALFVGPLLSPSRERLATHHLLPILLLVCYKVHDPI